MKYVINFLKFEIHKTFAVLGCPKVACSRDGAREIFCSPLNNALSSSRAYARAVLANNKVHLLRFFT